MTIEEAKTIVQQYEYKSVLSADEEFMLTEALSFLIAETKNPEYMVRLGGYYYGERDFDLALKYYEMADSYGDSWAPEGLGYIWYYGRTGEKDYKKAFEYFSKASENGYIRSTMKVADMYKNGYYVEKDYEEYCRIIEELYDLVLQYDVDYVAVDIIIRLGRIRKHQGEKEEAVRLFLDAKNMLARKLTGNHFFGDLNVMRWLMDDLYELIEVDPTDMDLYDLNQVLKNPCKVVFLYEGQEYEVESVRDPEGISIRFGDTWYRDMEDFYKKAAIGEKRLSALYYDLYAFRIV